MDEKLITKESVGYSGSVKLSVKKGQKTLSSRIIKNNGCLPLFKFIANCLKGEMLTSMLPCKICLFSKSDTENADKDSTWRFSKDIAISPYIYITSAGVSTDSTEPAAQTKYVFRIPYNQIANNKIYKMALYDASPTDFDSSKYAYIGLTKTENDQTTWEPLEIDENTKKYALEIEWTLKIQNA